MLTMPESSRDACRLLSNHNKRSWAKGVRRCCACFKFRTVATKGASLLLLCNILFQLEEKCSVTIYTNALAVDVVYFSLIFSNIMYVLKFLYPIMGYIADAMIGRYRMIIISLSVRLAGAVVSGIGYNVYLILDYGNWGRVLMYIGLALSSLGNAGYNANIVPYIVDQMIGASAEQLSAAIHWFYWAIAFGEFFSYILAYFMYLPYLARVLTPLLCVCSLAIGLDLVQRLNRHLDLHPQINNPVRTIFQVLYYARKNRSTYQRNRRSAFTYWDEKPPSNIDLAKLAYGGYFSEEVVEDVKTVLRLTPIVFCISVWTLLSDPFQFYHHFDDVLRYWLFDWANFFIYKIPFVTQLIILLVILGNEIIFHRYIGCFVPRMLKQIGFGLLSLIISVVFFLTIDTIGHLTSSEHIQCYFNVCWNGWPRNSTGIPINHQWILVSRIIEVGVVIFLVIPSLEFIVAQSPSRMRGLMVGIWYASGGFLQLVMKNSFFVFLFVKPLQRAIPSCMTYYYVTKIAFLSLVFLIFIRLAYKYQMRQREVVVNIHNIAEEHYERYIDQEEEYRKEMGLSSSISSSSSSDDD